MKGLFLVIIAALSTMPAYATPAKPKIGNAFSEYFRKHYCPTSDDKIGSHRIEPSSEMRRLVSQIDDASLSSGARVAIQSEIQKFGFQKIHDLQLTGIRISSSAMNGTWSIVEAGFAGESMSHGASIFRQCALSLVFPGDATSGNSEHFDLIRNCQEARATMTFDPMEGPVSVGLVFDVVDIGKHGKNSFVLEIVQPYGSDLVAYEPEQSGWREVFRGCGQGE